MKSTKMYGFLMAAFVALSFLIVDPSAYAKGGGGGGGGHSFSGGGRSSSSFSGGFGGGGRSATSTHVASNPSPKAFSGGGRPAAAPAASAQKNSFTGGGRDGQVQSRAGATSQNQPTVAKSPFEQKMGQQVSAERSKAALDAQRAQQAKFKQTGSPVSASPTTTRYVTRNVYVNNYHYTPAGYAYRQQSFYTYYQWSPPSYMYVFHPYYGMWNTSSLCFMLDHAMDQQYAMMYYSHRNDADMQAWRQQAEREAQNNAELRQKLAIMDQRVRSMEQQGVQADPGYVPPDMKDVALSENALKNAEQAASQPQAQQQQVQAVPAVYTEPAAPEHKVHWALWTFGAIIVVALLTWGLL